MKTRRILNLGCGPFVIKGKGYENVDISPEDESITQVDLRKPWPWNAESVDAMVSYHVLQEFQWRELIPFLREAYRVLKKGGIFRIGVPHIDSGLGVQFLLMWGNINLFSEELLRKVLEEIGFTVKKMSYRVTDWYPENELVVGDNREQETLFIEAHKL